VHPLAPIPALCTRGPAIPGDSAEVVTAVRTKKPEAVHQKTESPSEHWKNLAQRLSLNRAGEIPGVSVRQQELASWLISEWAGAQGGGAALRIAGDQRWLENEAIDYGDKARRWRWECGDCRDLWRRYVAARGDLRAMRTIGRIGSKTRKVLGRHSRHAGASRHAVVLAVSATTRGRGRSRYSESRRSEEAPHRY
jgi:hypothetical protein